MSELEQLERRVQNLSPDDLAKFRAWFLELDGQLWDQQIAEDLKAGKLDRLIAEAREDFAAGRAPDGRPSRVQSPIRSR
jgi:hypothetical protein